MFNFIEYEMKDGATILVSAPDREERGLINASLSEEAPVKAKIQFEEAIGVAKIAAKKVLDEFKDFQGDEVSIEFGLTTTGEAGVFGIGKVGMEANFVIKVVWKK